MTPLTDYQIRHALMNPYGEKDAVKKMPGI
jgi:hypothetical protein